MAQSLSVRAGSSVASRVWTFIFRGGESFALALEGKLGPGHEHDGGMSLWKFVGTEGEAQEAEDTIRRGNPDLRIERLTEGEDDEMLAERRRRLGLDPAGG